MTRAKHTERVEAEATMETAPTGEAAEREHAKNLKKEHDGAAYAVEGTAEGGQPSRKSTRGSANRAKPDSTQHHRAVEQTRSPSHRHSMRGG